MILTAVTTPPMMALRKKNRPIPPVAKRKRSKPTLAERKKRSKTMRTTTMKNARKAMLSVKQMPKQSLRRMLRLTKRPLKPPFLPSAETVTSTHIMFTASTSVPACTKCRNHSSSLSLPRRIIPLPTRRTLFLKASPLHSSRTRSVCTGKCTPARTRSRILSPTSPRTANATTPGRVTSMMSTMRLIGSTPPLLMVTKSRSRLMTAISSSFKRRDAPILSGIPSRTSRLTRRGTMPGLAISTMCTTKRIGLMPPMRLATRFPSLPTTVTPSSRGPDAPTLSLIASRISHHTSSAITHGPVTNTT